MAESGLAPGWWCRRTEAANRWLAAADLRSAAAMGDDDDYGDDFEEYEEGALIIWCKISLSRAILC